MTIPLESSVPEPGPPVVITASGEGVEMVALKALANGISVAAAEALVRPAK